VLLGVGGVGKSAFTARYASSAVRRLTRESGSCREFSSRSTIPLSRTATVLFSFRVTVALLIDLLAGKPFECDNVNYILEILDTAGTVQPVAPLVSGRHDLTPFLCCATGTIFLDA
jgi:hypothetical protein